MLEIYFLTLAEVLVLHDWQIKEFGGSFGVRDQGLLESALHQPQIAFGGQRMHEDIYAMAAAYAFHLIKNHPFVDGNKRTAIFVSLNFLEINGSEIDCDHQQLYQLAIDIAESKISKEAIADFFRKNVLES